MKKELFSFFRLPKRKLYQEVNEGEVVYLHTDEMETKRYLFGLYSRKEWAKAPYCVVHKSLPDEGFITMITQSVDDDSTRTICVRTNQPTHRVPK